MVKVSRTNKHNLPQPLYDAIANPSYDSGESTITVTSLINSPRLVELERRYKDEIEIDVTEDFAAWVGSTIHDALEISEKTHLVEERLYVTREGWKIGGKFDRLWIGLDNDSGELCGEVQDWKCILTSAVQFQKWEWEAQLNMLAWILRENGYIITSLRIYAILLDWRKKNIGRVKDYPESPCVEFEIPLWTHSRCEEYVAGRLALHKEARSCVEDNDLYLCSPEERWARSDTFAIKKEGRKTAVRVLEDHEEAKEYIINLLREGKIKEKDLRLFSIEHRSGENIRCDNYCVVKDFCNYFKSEKKDE